MIFEKVKSILEEQMDLGDDIEITMDTSFVEDLEADSLDVVELIIAIESEFNISVEDEDVENIKTVGDVVNYISDHQ